MQAARKPKKVSSDFSNFYKRRKIHLIKYKILKKKKERISDASHKKIGKSVL